MALKPNATNILGSLLIALVCITTSITTHGQSTRAELWEAIKSEDVFVMMRHSTAPGTGDPSNFDVNDCSTQRNLSDSGREQARGVGDQFRENGITSATIYSSPWCRCFETAELLGLGEVDKMLILSSFYEQRQNQRDQNQELRQWLIEQSAEHPISSVKPTLLVTHQVNITALTGSRLSEGAMLVVRLLENGDLDVLGSIRPN